MWTVWEDQSGDIPKEPNRGPGGDGSGRRDPTLALALLSFPPPFPLLKAPRAGPGQPGPAGAPRITSGKPEVDSGGYFNWEGVEGLAGLFEPPFWLKQSPARKSPSRVMVFHSVFPTLKLRPTEGLTVEL